MKIKYDFSNDTIIIVVRVINIQALIDTAVPLK